MSKVIVSGLPFTIGPCAALGVGSTTIPIPYDSAIIGFIFSPRSRESWNIIKILHGDEDLFLLNERGMSADIFTEIPGKWFDVFCECERGDEIDIAAVNISASYEILNGCILIRKL